MKQRVTAAFGVTRCFLFIGAAFNPFSTLSVAADEAQTESDTNLESDSANKKLAAAVLQAGLAASADTVVLANCRLPRERLSAVFSGVLTDCPDLFHVDNRMSYTYDKDGKVLAVFPAYTLVGEELTAARRLYRDTIDEFCRALSAVQAQDPVPLTLVSYSETIYEPDAAKWMGADTVLFLHEWMVTRFVYDETETRFDALSLFRAGVGVCQAYALAFSALARAAGLTAGT